MATTPYFLWPQNASSAAASDRMAAFEFNPHEETLVSATAAMDMATLHAPELSEAVARPRLRRQASSSASAGRQQGTGGSGTNGTPEKPPQRGLGVAELERLRCGGVDPLQDLNVAAAAAMLEAAATAANSAPGNSVLLHQQHHQDHVPAFDAATGARYYSPLLVQPPPAPPAPVRYVHGMAPEQQYYIDRWGRMGGFLPAASCSSSRRRRKSNLQAKTPSGVPRPPPPPASTLPTAATSAARR